MVGFFLFRAVKKILYSDARLLHPARVDTSQISYNTGHGACQAGVGTTCVLSRRVRWFSPLCGRQLPILVL